MDHKLLLIGWDAADWKIITPLMDAGKMPNLQRLVERGVMGNITTLKPVLSPMLWTSIATGKRPFKHGILGFSEPMPDGSGVQPISNLSRKTRALWNMTNLRGKKANVVGWWPSHPAEPIDGVMISNHFQQAAGPLDQPWPMRPGTVHPPELAEKLAAYRIHPAELTADHVGPFVPNLAKVDQDQDQRLESVAKILAECSGIHAAATAVMQLEPWDVMAVYYDAIDHFGHGFMQYHPPQMSGVSDEDFELYKEVVEGGYRFHDMMLGTLLALAGEDTHIMLCSDHGFHPDHLRPSGIPLDPAGPAVQHRDHGILVMAGPGIKKDERIYGASLLDVTPTALHMLGLPVGRDMDGRPLVNAFDDGREVEWIDSWENVEGKDGAHPVDKVVDPLEAKESMDQLVALGYIDPPSEDMDQAVKETVRELDYNKARALMDAGLYLEATSLLEDLFREWEEESRFGIQLVQCYRVLGKNREARECLQELLQRKEALSKRAAKELDLLLKEHLDSEEWSRKDKRKLRRLGAHAGSNQVSIQQMLAEQALAEKKYEQALLHLKTIEENGAGSVSSLMLKGNVLLALKEYAEAQNAFTALLSIDAENADACIGLCRCYLKQRQNMLAAGVALDAIGLKYDSPWSHYLLGVALHRMGRLIQAVEALNVAVTQNPNFSPALKRLAYIHEKRFNNLERAETYRRRAEESREQFKAMKEGRYVPDSLPPQKGVMLSGDETLPIDRNAVPEMPGCMDETVVLVSGMPRPGTSMMMQMLHAGGLSALTDGQREADRDNSQGYFEYEPVKAIRRSINWMPEAKGKALKVVAPLLMKVPPQNGFKYRVIFMERNLKEVV